MKTFLVCANGAALIALFAAFRTEWDVIARDGYIMVFVFFLPAFALISLNIGYISATDTDRQPFASVRKFINGFKSGWTETNR